MKKSTVRMLSAAAVILPVVVLSCACAMVQMLLSNVPSAAVAGVIGLVIYVIWAGGIVLTIVRRLRGASLTLSLLLLCSLALFPQLEMLLKNRSNHFEIHLELKNSGYLRDFVTVSRRLGLRIDDIEANQAYAGSGLSVFTVTFTICSAELKKYKTHREIIEALSSLDYIYHIEEMR